MGANPAAAPLGALVLYNTLGATLPDGDRRRGAALAGGAGLRKAIAAGGAPRASSSTDELPDEALGDALFDAIVCSREAVLRSPSTTYDDVWSLVEPSRPQGPPRDRAAA